MKTVSLLYLIAAACFILTLRGLSSPKTARAGNGAGMAGMAIAVFAVFLFLQKSGAAFSLPAVLPTLAVVAAGACVGIFIALRIRMTALPQLIAAFHSLVGLAAAGVAWASFLSPELFGIAANGAIKTASLIEMSLGCAIGALTFSGSVVAFAKLQGILSGRPLRFPLRHAVNAVLTVLTIAYIVLFARNPSILMFSLLTGASFVLGFLLILPVGAADMPIVVSMLNSYSGWAAAGIGFTMSNPLLIVTGALVGASGAILSHIMCKAMNRSLLSVIFALGKSGGDAGDAGNQDKTARIGSVEDAAFLMKNASKVIIAAGYGMATAQAQHALGDLAKTLKENGARVAFAVHPVAGRMPGHMNVLLAEANVPYEDVFELEDINGAFETADVAYVIGANDITNPSAKTDPNSALFGMPVLDVGKAKTVLCVKRSLDGTGYAGVDNPLFYADNTLMILGDAKKVTEGIVKAMKED